jgi:hypothetical protein
LDRDALPPQRLAQSTTTGHGQAPIRGGVTVPFRGEVTQV